jgi:molybdate-binding protein/DNA-binding XRE family transcriptional regulator
MSSKTDNTTSGQKGVTSRLAGIRRQRGLGAAELARAAGVTRQTVYAMEAGDYVPNTAVALRLARALETRVEDLFALDEPAGPAPAPLRAQLISSADCWPGAPLETCRVDGRLIAAPAMSGPWQFPPADALLADATRSTVQLLHEESTAARLMIAGCDPAVSVLRRHLERAGVELAIAAVNSSVAVDLLDQRLTHVAGTHLKDAETPRAGMAVFRFAVWEQGLVLARGNPKKVKGIDGLARPDIRFANREKGSGSRQLLDDSLRDAVIPAKGVAGYRDRPATGHMEAAWRVHAGLADCCVATRSAARAFGLAFVPLTSERYDLMLREEHLRLGAVEKLLDTLTHSALRRELEGLCAYDTRETGNRVQ